MSIKQKRYLAAASVIGLGLILLIALTWQSEQRFDVPIGQVESSNVGGIKSGAVEKQPPTRSRFGASADTSPKLRVMTTLRSGSRDRWLSAIGLLEMLPPAEQWKVLTAPGISDQLQSKALQEDMLMACAVALRKVEVGGDLPVDDDVVGQWCFGLLEVGTAAQFFARFRALQTDSEFQTADFRLLGVDRDQMTGREAAAMGSSLRDRLATTARPAEIQGTVGALWQLRSDIFGNLWPQVETLSDFQRGRLEAALRKNVACQATGGCGPGNISTLEFCAVMPGIICTSGQGLNEIFRSNLSPLEYRLLRDMTAKLLAERQLKIRVRD